MSLPVTDPSGVEWDVSREWLSRPLWKGDSVGYPVDVDFPTSIYRTTRSVE